MCEHFYSNWWGGEVLMTILCHMHVVSSKAYEKVGKRWIILGWVVTWLKRISISCVQQKERQRVTNEHRYLFVTL